ncbi:Tip attachment protein J [uncultured Caudovirales phage]|uniref:Tip attachment protein J n=1 Tax=uncultured Caudovirales phage TaxID=2100421 RepID=A0A6J5Q5M4_9CAUD|nr:Tip attachment protein J [uncultured Caudovirales phage]CAB4210915.1 Tip attachment protein J [uncultured Caudovirales phage]CAB4223366.1 Tip attachment protein J [uncultured Caudovirales phage]
MPPIIAAVAAYAASAAAAAVMGAAFAATLAGSIISTLVGAVASMLVSSIFKSSAKSSNNAAAVDMSRDRTLTIKQPTAPWRIVYGQCRTGGVFTYVKSMNSNQNLLLITSISGHPLTGIDELLFDDQTVPFTDDGGGVFTLSGRYATTKMRFGQGSSGVYETAFQSAVNTDSDGEWTSNHKQEGRGKLYTRLTYNVDTFPNGTPNITAVVRGKTVYDPRTATTAWHHNPALCLSDYLTNTDFGMGATYATEIDEDSLIAAANICDEIVAVVESADTFTADASTDIITRTTFNARCNTGDRVQVSSTTTLPAGLSAATNYYYIRVTRLTGKLATSYANAIAGAAINITDAGTGTHTLTRKGEPRYTANGTIQTDDKPVTVIERMLSAMSGKCVYTGGVWKIYAGAYITPTVTLDETYARGPITAQTRITRRENFNAVKGIYVSPYDNWQPTDFPAVTNATYLSEDNSERVWRDADLAAFTISPSMAQRLAKIELEKARQQISVSFPAKLSAYQVEPPDVIGLTNTRRGWTSKAFEVVRGDLNSEADNDGNPTLGYDLYLRETASTVYDWNNGEETTIDPAPDSDLPNPFNVIAPGSLSISEEIYVTRSGSAKAKAIIQWGASADGFLREYQLEYKLTSDTDYFIFPRLTDTYWEILDITPGNYNFRVKSVNELGVSSSYSTASAAISGLSANPSAPTNLTLNTIGGFALLRWDVSTDTDVLYGGSVEFRHDPALTGATIATSTSIGEVIPGNSTLTILPLKAGTYLVRFLDSTGNYSSAASFATAQNSALTYSVLTSVTEDPTFSGTKSNLTVASSTLKLSTSQTTGTYTFNSMIDLTTVKNARLTVAVESNVFNPSDTIDSRTAFMDTWTTFDGDIDDIGVADCRVFVRSTQTDPAGSPTWTDWQRLDSAEFGARGFQFKAVLTTTDTAYNIGVTALSVVASEVV